MVAALKDRHSRNRDDPTGARAAKAGAPGKVEEAALLFGASAASHGGKTFNNDKGRFSA